MGRYFFASFSFELAFCISTVLPLVIHSGASPSSNHSGAKQDFYVNW